MKFDSTQSDQFDPSRTHKPHELDDERLIQDGFSKLPEPTPPTEAQDGNQENRPMKYAACTQYSNGNRCILPLGHDGDHQTAPHVLTYGPCEGEIATGTWPQIKQEEGTFACPICGASSPHEHTSNEIAEFRVRGKKSEVAVAAPTERVETSPLPEIEVLYELRDGQQPIPWEAYKASDIQHLLWKRAAVAPSPAPVVSQELIQEMLAALKYHHEWQLEHGQNEGFGYINSKPYIDTATAIKNAEATNA